MSMITSKYIFLNNFLFKFILNNNRVEETASFLNMLQVKLQNEKKNISQHQDIQRIPFSYPYVSFTQWDMILRKTYFLF